MTTTLKLTLWTSKFGNKQHAFKLTSKEAQKLKWNCSIKNKGKTNVVLVCPGDGSEAQWRTPFIGWTVQTKHAVQSSVPKQMDRERCGNMNELTSKEIVTVEPGKVLTLDSWLDFPPIYQLEAGKYFIQFYYKNIPELPWRKSDQQNENLIKKVRESTPCFLISNVCEIEITDKQ